MVMGSVPLVIAPERVQRVIDALSMIGVDEHAAALSMLPETDVVEDAFDMLEACVRVLVGEVAEAQAANDRYARALEESRQQLADKLAVIQRQTVALADLSTPIIEIWEHTLALPIVGAVDAARAAAIAEALLHEVVARRARHVLLDLTGVDAVDAATFEHLAGLVRAVALIGARCTLTGVSPAVAGAVVGLDLDLTGLTTRSTLKEGLLDVLVAPRRPGRPR